MHKRLNSQDFPNLRDNFDKEIVLYLLQIKKAILLDKEHVTNNILSASENGSLDRELARESRQIPGVISAREKNPQYPDLERILDQELARRRIRNTHEPYYVDGGFFTKVFDQAALHWARNRAHERVDSRQ